MSHGPADYPAFPRSIRPGRRPMRTSSWSSASRDEVAYELLVRRYARLVLAVCRRVLADVNDAFQATSLVLARKAHSIARAEAIAAWLHVSGRSSHPRRPPHRTALEESSADHLSTPRPTRAHGNWPGFWTRRS